METFLFRRIRQLAKLFAWFACFVLVAILAVTFFDVVGRTLFGRALVGAVEAIELMMGILVFSGLALTELKRRHVNVETFQALFPAPAFRLSVILNCLIAVLVVGLMTWRMVVKSMDTWEEQEFTQIWELPFWPTAFIMTVGLGLFLLVLLIHLYEAIAGREVKEE